MSSKTAGSVTVNSTGEYVYDDPRGCTSFRVRVPSTAAVAALVNIPGLHDAGEFFTVPIGAEELFRLNNLGIRKVFIKGSGGNCTVLFGVLSMTSGV